MRYRVLVQRPVNEGPRRGSKTEWENVLPGTGLVWVSIKQSRVAEGAGKPNQLTIVGTYEIRIWSIPGLDETWRLVHGDHVYNIVSVDQPNLTVKEIVIIAKRDKLKTV
jgi:hypothetical protein